MLYKPLDRELKPYQLVLPLTTLLPQHTVAMAPGSMVSKPPPSPTFFGSDSRFRKLEILASGRNTTADKHKEPPDPLVTETPTAKHVWRPPPSRTTAPTTIDRESILRHRMEPPRFTGEDASNWIHKIQRYFNHSYTPESDRLYLVTFLFDPPASDWATYWKENNTGKDWNDFLIAVKHCFDPNFDEGYASNKTTIELPDSPAFPSDTSGWRLPPSLTQPPTGMVPSALSRPRFDAPRFDGANVVEWICNMQRYYNHYYTPLSDRLYLTQYLFDQPASDWMTSWKYNHAEESWDDFLLAVKQQFDPNPYEGRVATLRNTPTVHVVSDDGADLSITLDKQAATSGMGEETDDWSLMYHRATPVQKPHTSTSDMLTWSEAPSAEIPSAATAARASQPTDGVGTVLFDGQIIDGNVENLNERKPCSGYKLKEMNGSNIIAGDSGDGSTDSIASDHDTLISRISLHIVQQAPIIAGDSGHPCLPEKQKFSGFDAPSDGDNASFSIESAYYIKDPTFAATLKPLFSSDMKSFLEPHIFPGVGIRGVFTHTQALASDARSIPPRNDVTRSGECLSTGGSKVTHRSLGDDPIESVIFKSDGSSALSALHLRLEFPTLVDILSVPPLYPMIVEMEMLLDQFMAWMTKQQGENMKRLYRHISVSCPLPAKLTSRRCVAF